MASTAPGLETAKEGAGLVLGLIAAALATGMDLDLAHARVVEVFSGVDGMRLRLKGQFTSDELVDMVRAVTR